MCMVNSDKGKFEVIVTDLKDQVICDLKMASITLVCRFLVDFDFQYGNCIIFRISDMQRYDPQDLLELWNGVKE